MPTRTPETPLLTTDEVARRLAVDPSTVRRIIAAGALPAAKIGRQHRVDPTDLQKYLQAARVHSTPLVAS